MDTEKVCTRCGKRCVPAQSYCPKCGAALPAATPALAPASSGPRCTVVLNRGHEERTLEAEGMEQAMNEAMPWVLKGYIARIKDENEVVRWTQALEARQVITYAGDATNQAAGSGAPAAGQGTAPVRAKPWWRFW